MNELSFWDYITLGIALIVICAYVVMRVMRALESNKRGGCNGCSKGSCSTPANIDVGGCSEKERGK
ncbi:MAG: FeoB-associated Cys-rich membrane protein [Sedimenticola sp.]